MLFRKVFFAYYFSPNPFSRQICRVLIPANEDGTPNHQVSMFVPTYGWCRQPPKFLLKILPGVHEMRDWMEPRGTNWYDHNKNDSVWSWCYGMLDILRRRQTFVPSRVEMNDDGTMTISAS